MFYGRKDFTKYQKYFGKYEDYEYTDNEFDGIPNREGKQTGVISEHEPFKLAKVFI